MNETYSCIEIIHFLPDLLHFWTPIGRTLYISFTLITKFILFLVQSLLFFHVNIFSFNHPFIHPAKSSIYIQINYRILFSLTLKYPIYYNGRQFSIFGLLKLIRSFIHKAQFNFVFHSSIHS